MDAGGDSPSETSQVHYQERLVKSGPARTSKAMSLPSDPVTKEKMETCCVPPRRSWHCISVLTMEMIRVRSGSPRSSWFCLSPPILPQFSQDIRLVFKL